MLLAVSVRRSLLVLLSGIIFVLLLLYWNQVKKTQALSDAVKRAQRNLFYQNVIKTPVENTWTFKCEYDRCVRKLYYYGKGVRRVTFMTCSMTCGDINIWPHPTVKSLISARTLKFSVKDVQLRIDSPYAELHNQFQLVFLLFLKNLHQMQRLAYSESETTSYDLMMDSSSLSQFGNVLGTWPRGYINALIVKVSVHKFADMDLSLDTDESYQLSSNFEKKQLNVHITANTFFGARHGLSTLQQLIWYDDEDQLLHTYMKSVISDAPKFRYRGLMLDTSRHFFSVDSIKRTIAAMGLSKLNRFHWHITDSQSFPYISKNFPEMAQHGAYSDSETYSQEDILEITAFAKLHGVQVIAEIDAPAHAGNGWDWGPKNMLGELSLCINQQPWNFYCGEPPCGQLNPKNNNTYLILQRLYEEMLQLTGTTDFFHLGGDEVNLDCWAQYFNDTDFHGLWCDFMLHALTRLKIANNNVLPKVVAVWSSALTNTKCLPNSQFAVQMWGGSKWLENFDLIDDGFNVIFSHVDAWYLDCGFGSWRSSGETGCTPYHTWQTVYKHRPWASMYLDETNMKQVLGGEVCMWTEQVNEDQLDNRLWPRSAALGERLWSDPPERRNTVMIPPETLRRMSIFRSRLVEMGIHAEAILPRYCAQNPGECS